MYEEFDAVLLKDGRFASLDDKDGPGSYTGTVGDGPRDWKIVYLTDADIERKLTDEELCSYFLPYGVSILNVAGYLAAAANISCSISGQLSA